jgi:aspartate/methionine/tyrosine aminotransferase
MLLLMTTPTCNDRDLTRHQLSSRGRQLLQSPPFPEYLQAHFRHAAEPYDPATRPSGYIGLCIAENKLVWDLLQPKMLHSRDIPQSVLAYDAMIGALEFRQQLSRFMGRTFLGRTFPPEQIAVLSGAGSVLETMFYAIADPGDGILIPTPSYAGFWMDLQTRNQLQIVPVHCTSDEQYRLTRHRLDSALQSAGRPVKALLFTTPNNPLGTVYGRDEIAEVLDWAAAHQLHVVFDEIYALSVFGDQPFISCASVVPSLGEHVHIVWAFSKDFAASGLRCGVLVSENQGLLQAVDGLSYWACCSGDTQFLLGRLISDDEWVDSYIAANQRRLRDAYTSAARALEEQEIPYLPAGSGFFILCDLRRYLEEVTWESEARLWRRLIDQGNVNLTPGAACHNGEPGFMRLCYASNPPEVVAEGVRRVGATCHELSKGAAAFRLG